MECFVAFIPCGLLQNGAVVFIYVHNSNVDNSAPRYIVDLTNGSDPFLGPLFVHGFSPMRWRGDLSIRSRLNVLKSLPVS